MRIILGLILPILLVSSCNSTVNKTAQINVVHWNIKELSTDKLNKKSEQLQAVNRVLRNFKWGLLSVNELQYDKVGVPSNTYRSQGVNAEKLAKLLGHNTDDMAISFTQANTGNKAKKKNGEYLTQMSREARALADQDNFGIFPGQYSTALLSKFPIKSEIIIKDLKWREFNPKTKFRNYRRTNKGRLPTSIELFDKSFSHIIIDVEGIEVNVIGLHTVPAFGFGNKRTPNMDRNRDQLRFLEWYLTGGTDIPVKMPKRYEHIRPLEKDAKFIAMGDWNVSIYDNKSGSLVLKRLFNSVNLWLGKPPHTHESQHFGQKRNKLTLDYIAYRGLKLKDAGVYRPDDTKGTCINYKDIPASIKTTRYKIDENKCFNEDAVDVKTASDHFPIWASFEL
jgi:hypothetical protein